MNYADFRTRKNLIPNDELKGTVSSSRIKNNKATKGFLAYDANDMIIGVWEI